MTAAAANPSLTSQDNADLGGHRHILALDGLRGLAILFVMIFHMTILTTTTLADRMWINFAGFGWVGVDLFFVLSGFLITGILYDARRSSTYFRSFYARRILRIFPLYYLVVSFCLLVLPHLHNAKSSKFGSIHGDEIWYWTYLSNYIIGYRHAFRHGILDVSWTLAIEEQFYLIWPAVVLLFSRRTLLWLCGILIAIAIITRTALVLHGASPIVNLTFTPSRMDSLVAGAAVALLVRGKRGIVRLVKPARILAITAGAIMFIHLLWRGPSYDDSSFGQCLGYTLMAIFFAACLVLSLQTPKTHPWSRFLSNPVLRQLGRYSYALYLFNFPLRALIRDTVYGPARFPTLAGSQLPGQILFYLFAMGISFAAAWLSWHLFEVHFLRLKKLFPMSRANAPQMAPAPP